MALAQKTDILLLDEPTTYLDIAHQLDVMEMLQKINQEYNLTILMVLHDLQQAAHYCDYLIAMKRGKIVTTGTPEDILSREFFFSMSMTLRPKSNLKTGIPSLYLQKQED